MYNEFFVYHPDFKKLDKQARATLISKTFKERAHEESLLPEYVPNGENSTQMRKDHLIFHRQGDYFEKLMTQQSMIEMLKLQNYIYWKEIYL